MTRAQVVLNMSFPVKGNAQNEGPELSPFLSEPGMSNYFEEHGPSISDRDVKALAITLGRDQPTADAIAKGKKSLERDEDNYWPLTGEVPPEEWAKRTNGQADDTAAVYGNTRSASWVKGSVTMQAEGAAQFSTGFVSVKSKFGEIAQQREKESRLRALDKRAAEQSKIAQDKAPKGAKRQIEGQGTISSFFGKKPRTGDAPVTVSQATQQFTPAATFRTSSAPLRDVSNINKLRDSHTISSKPLPTLQHRVRAVPSQRKPLAHSTSDPTVRTDNGYVFLSSPPPQPEEEEDPEPAKVELHKVSTSHTSSFKPASTFHSTLMNNIPSQRRTLGLGKMKPWSARGGKR